MRFSTIRRLALVPALLLSLGAAACGAGGGGEAGLGKHADKAAMAHADKAAPANMSGKLAALVGAERGAHAAHGGDDGARGGLIAGLKGALAKAKTMRLEDLGVTDADLEALGVTREELGTLREQAAQLWREGMDAAEGGELDPGYADDGDDDGGYDPSAY